MDISMHIPKIVNAQKKVMTENIELWREHALFSPTWWLLLAMLIVPWIIWWLLVDRKRIMEIFGVGMTVGAIANILDTHGIVTGNWIYLVELVPDLPQLLPMDYSVIPVGYMLAYQYASSWKRFSIVAIIFSLFGAYIIEPIFIHLKIYVLLDWKHWYSAVIYFMMAMFVKWLVDHVFLKKRDKMKSETE